MSPASLPELSGVTSEQFRHEIEPAGKPVVLRGIISDWELVGKADDPRVTADFLKHHVGSQPVTISRMDKSQGGRFFYAEDMRQLNFTDGKAPFVDFIEWLLAGANGDTLYMASTPAKEIFPGLASMFDLPHVPLSATPRIFIGNRTVVSTHNDGSSNIATIAAGRRIFTLFAPEQVANLYPGPIEHTPAGPQLSMVDLSNPDLDRFPRFPEAMATAQSAELGPGDGIYIPPLWWHDVRAQSDFNILVNYWWRDRPRLSREPMEAFLLSLLAVRQLPDHEREAWRAMFDYFVFKTSGEPMEHLPDQYQGILGTINDAKANQIWKFFTDMMK